MKDPIVIDPPGFDQKAAWGECHDYVEKCGGLADDEGNPNWRAAFGADPGCCSCPACGEYYWAWGRKQRCVKCSFEYETDWWPRYSEGCNHGRIMSGAHVCPDAEFSERMKRSIRRDLARNMQHPYYKFGFEHPVADAWWCQRMIDWPSAVKGQIMYTPSDRVCKQLSSTFRYHRPQGNQPERYECIRDEAGKLAMLIATNTPESREQSLALTKLEEVVMFANAAIARNEEWDGNEMKSPLQLKVQKEVRG